MLEALRTRLQELGLPHKEADVYLAMLELGPRRVQEIAEKAGVNRSTCYLLLASLQERGLASTFEQEKKTVFAAESPERLVTLIVNRLTQAQRQQQLVDEALPKLFALFNARPDKPTVRFFEGEEAVARVRWEIADLREPVWELCAIDEAQEKLAAIAEDERLAVTRRVQGRLLLAIKAGYAPPAFDARGIEVRQMEYERAPFSGVLSLIGERLYLLTSMPHGMGIVVEHPALVGLFRALYEAAWSGAKPWSPPGGWKGF